MNKSEIIADLKFIEDRIRNGCGNHGCRILKPTGQGTNASCSCRKELMDLLMSILERVKKLGRNEL